MPFGGGTSTVYEKDSKDSSELFMVLYSTFVGAAAKQSDYIGMRFEIFHNLQFLEQLLPLSVSG